MRDALGDLSATVETRTDAKESKFKFQLFHNGEPGNRYFSTLDAAQKAADRANELAKGNAGAKNTTAGPRVPGVTLTTSEARAEARRALAGVKRASEGYGKGQQRLIDLVAGKVDRNSASEFQRVIGIDVKQTGASIANEIQDFRKENTDLITSIPEQLIDQVSDTLEKGWDAGVRVEELSAQIQKQFGSAESRADLIARDQTLKLNAQISETRAVASGITRYIWSTSHDERVRGNPSGKYPNPSKTGRVTADHYHLDGKTFSYSDPPVVDERTGRRENPGGDYQCRCTAAPVLDWLEE